MRKKILIPYFLAGSGHLVSATAIHHFLSGKKPDWECRLFEPARELRIDMLNKLYIKSWHFVLKRPKTSALVFYLSEHVFWPISLAINRYATRKAAPAMRDFLIKYKPDLIITTHWGCGHLVAEAMKIGAPKVPLFVVRNDLGGAYRIQKVDCDLTVVMSANAVQAFRRLGVPESRLYQANLLVRPQFSRDASVVDGSLERPFKILLSSGGEGLGNISKTARSMLAEGDRSRRDLSIDILTGRNTELKEQLEAVLEDPRVTVHGYREDVDRLMREADIVVGKCGANYTMETAMSGKPFLVTQVGAPSERPNLRFVLEGGLGWYAPNSLSLRDVLRQILTEDGFIDKVLRNLDALPRKNGAEEIAEKVIAEVDAEIPVADRPGI